MTLTERQSEALDILLGSLNVLLYGGARSGKTAVAIYFGYYCCLTFPGLRMLVARRYATDIRAAVWNDTMPKVARLLGLELGREYKTNEQQMIMDFPNGSGMACAGLDDKERVDKILGQEYAIIYVNESQDVGWSVVKTIKTRLAQRVDGFKNRFICDLNPTSVEHWTYKLWFEGMNPESEAPVKGSYGKLLMNPRDNEVNLGEGYIEEQLEGLTGDARRRFLLGEYSTNSDLQVFIPAALHDDLEEDFRTWAAGKWHAMEVTGALDLGFEDADAAVMLAYVDGEPDIWLIEEYKDRQNDVTTLGKDLGRMISDVWERYPFKAQAKDNLQVWTDTGGLGKKTAVELAEAFGLPIRQAYKRDKDVGLRFVQDDVNNGRLHMARKGLFAEECRKIVWRRDKDTGKVDKGGIDDDIYHPDVMDAVIYAYRFLMKYGNGAMMGRTVEAIKGEESGGKTFFDMEAEVMKAMGQEEAVW